MKTKAKLTLAISAMSAVVLAAGVTSTFAWFTTNSSATANFSNLTVNAPSSISISGYQIAFNGSDGTSAVTQMTQTAKNVVTGTTAALGAVSSADGKTFYAPDSILADDAPASSHLNFVAWASATANKYKSYVKYNFSVTLEKVKSSEDIKHVKVELVQTTAESPIDDWYRVAIYHTSDTTLNTADERAKDTTHPFEAVFGKTGTTADKYVAKAGQDDGTGVILSNRTVISKDAEDPTDISGFVPSVSADVTWNFVVAVFLEGTATTESQNTGAGKALDVGLRFSYYTPTPSGD